jgi:crossover junction endodeoxyribonuclease RuvC
LRILGIDPGTRVVGYGIVDKVAAAGQGDLKAVAWGAIRVRPSQDISRRLLEIHQGLARVIEEYKPDEVALEEAFFGRNARAALRIGEGRGAAMLSTALSGLAVHNYSAREVKKAVVGQGGASKEQVQRMVQVILGLKELPRPLDAADALGIAICHAHSKVALESLGRARPRQG